MNERLHEELNHLQLVGLSIDEAIFANFCRNNLDRERRWLIEHPRAKKFHRVLSDAECALLDRPCGSELVGVRLSNGMAMWGVHIVKRGVPSQPENT